MSTTMNEVSPWYKQFWPWFIIAFPASAVIAGIATVFIAVSNPDGLVKDDYYKAGLGINRTLEREQMAMKLGLSAAAKWLPQQQQISIQLEAPQPIESERLLLELVHPTRSGQDLQVPLLHQGNGRYSGLLENTPSAGNWYLFIAPEDNSWRINGRARLPEQTQWQLTP